MKSSITEVAAAWIVALALIGAMAVNVFLPKTPPTLGRGVTALGPARPAMDVPVSRANDPELPLLEYRVPSGPADDEDKAVAEPKGSRPGSGSELRSDTVTHRAGY